ncbi:MAG: polysaccharide deacetylase family protein [Bifidobacteriaceae bacterium]|nr:polysaccharide deacetylase family protein [Bifidobacteriaceae bacterium]
MGRRFGGTALGVALALTFAPSAAWAEDYEPIDCSEVKCVALTFDDGPGRYTKRYLKILRRHDAVATFFVIGSQVSGHKSLVKKMAAEGHEIASHTWNHPALTSLSGAQIDKQLERTARRIEKVTGVRPALVRPPYGSMNGRVLKAIGRSGASAILWDVDTRDWEHRSASRVFNHVKRDTRRGSIILMHDLHRASADALDRIITHLERRGFTLVTVSDILGGQPKDGKAYHSGLR